MSHPYPSRPIKVIHVRGTAFEIGKSHAELLGEECGSGMTSFYSSFWKRMLNAKASRWDQRLANKVIAKVVDPVLVNRLIAQLPHSVRETLRGLAHSKRDSLGTLLTSTVLPDLMPILLSLNAKLRPYTVIPACEPPLFGCSSFFARGRSLIHGRNLDFPGVGYWDRYSLIQLTEPKRGLRYIGFTTAGVPFCGITGVNEAQISVSLHQHYGRQFSFGGIPPFVISETILKEARSIPDALKILRSHRVSAAWAFLVGDGKTGDALIYENAPRSRGTIPLSENGGVLAHSNYFQSSECARDGYATTDRMNWDNYWRKTRLEQNVRAQNPTAQSACQFLSEHFDPYWGEEKIINRTVSQVYNIQSIATDLGEMKAWVAEGDAPIHLRHYAEFDLGKIFAGGEGRTGRVTKGYEFSDHSLRAAKENYILSFIASFDGDDVLALERIEKSLRESFCPEAAMVAGVLYLKEKEFNRGKDHFEKGVAWIEERLNGKPPPPEYFELLLFHARSLDLLGRTQEARFLYQSIAEHNNCFDAHLKRLARRKTQFRQSELDRVLTPFSTYIPLE